MRRYLSIKKITGSVPNISDSSSSDIDRVDTINDDYSHLPWLELVSLSEPFNYTFLIDKIIMEVMTSDEITWNYYYHHSYFLSDLDKIDNDFSTIFLCEIDESP